MDNVLLNFVSKIFVAKKVYINFVKQRVTYKYCTFIDPPPTCELGEQVYAIIVSCTEKNGGRVYVYRSEKDKSPLPLNLHMRATWLIG